MPTRRQILRAAAAMSAGLWLDRASGLSVDGGPTTASAGAAARRWEDRWPALRLRLQSPAPGSAPELDLRRDFGARGDGVSDDAPALQALADAVNSGQVPAGAVVTIPSGTYRVVGDDAITFRRPVVLRGEGPDRT